MGLSMLRERLGDSHFLLADLPPSSGQVRLARAVAIVLSIAFVISALFRDIPLVRIDVFIPITQTAIFFNDLITAVLLYSQFVIVGRLALLILANGYLFSSLVVLPYMATFPGVFPGLLGAGLQSAAWLFFFSHLGLPLAVILYASRKDLTERVSREARPPGIAIGWSIGIVIAAVIGLTLLCTTGHDLLPKVMLDPIKVDPTARIWFDAALQFTSWGALAILYWRRRSVLDCWLLVMCWAWVLELLLATNLITARFTVAWYGSRIFALAAALSVLIVLLSETTRLYAHLALSVVRRRQAAEVQNIAFDVMAASIAHEVRQPLAAILLNAESAKVMLSVPRPDIVEVRSALTDVADDARRVSEVIDGIRNMSQKDARGKVLLNLNNLIRDVFKLTDVDLRMQGVSIDLALRSELPPVLVNMGQIRQVMLNLIFNAAEALSAISDRPRILRIGSDVTQDNCGVFIAVEDSGTGVDEKDIERIFEPFFTTKPAGTGVGLAICRSIIEAHGGKLLASRNTPYGMIFRIYLPIGET
jgi:signal transduction histidine kinase